MDSPHAFAHHSSLLHVTVRHATRGRTSVYSFHLLPSAAAGLDELQQHRRAHSVDDKSSAAAAAAGFVPGHFPVLPLGAQNEALLEKCLDLLLVLSACDGVVKGWMCSKDNLQQLLDLTQRLQMPGLLKVCCCVRLCYKLLQLEALQSLHCDGAVMNTR
jgi:hypothetical protein